ncbi:MAG: hypothetical protein FJ112_11775 [Deltaproteobacteria bacterium]|nr:hypothetical protein [Deltaproteobacteria bacterium]
MFLLKKLLFKFMELGLGLRTCFSLDTKNPIFINFKLTEEELVQVKKQLPAGFKIQPIRFTENELEPSYWISYNFYELKYPKTELSAVKKARLEINTFVLDALGRPGVFVFCDSPFVSKETKLSVIGFICDFAEWLVTKIYGVGQMIPLQFSLDEKVRVNFKTSKHQMEVELPIPELEPGGGEKLSVDYWRFNDISFFNQGKTCDYVNVNSSFFMAEFVAISASQVSQNCVSPVFNRKPDRILVHRGEISYLVNSMNLCSVVGEANG